MRILLVEDHPIFRIGLRQLILQCWPDALVGEAQTTASALSAVHGEAWDMAVVDLNLPDTQGIESVTKIRRAKPDLPILVLSLHEQPTYVRQVMQQGAQGYLTKENAPDELIAALQAVLSGGRYISTTMAQSLALGAFSDEGTSALERLGSQEYRVMLQLIAGARISEIAVRLNISAKTVSTYRSRIFEKLGVGSNVELARYCLLHQISGESE